MLRFRVFSKYTLLHFVHLSFPVASFFLSEVAPGSRGFIGDFHNSTEQFDWDVVKLELCAGSFGFLTTPKHALVFWLELFEAFSERPAENEQACVCGAKTALFLSSAFKRAYSWCVCWAEAAIKNKIRRFCRNITEQMTTSVASLCINMTLYFCVNQLFNCFPNWRWVTASRATKKRQRSVCMHVCPPACLPVHVPDVISRIQWEVRKVWVWDLCSLSGSKVLD